MTATDERIDRIESRVERLESRLSEDIKEIRDILACMSKASVKPVVELESLVLAHNATMLRVERLEVQIIKLLQERAYILGGCAVIATIFSFIGVVIGIVTNWALNKP
jgi:hypothetical protein